MSDTAKEAPPDLRPRLEVRADLTLVSDEALAILAADADSGLYVRSGLLMRVVRDDARRIRGISREAGAPVIERVPLPWLRDRLGRSILWWEKKQGKKRRALVPGWVAENIYSRAELPFPPLEGVVEAPTLRRDGSVLDQPGYDEKSALLYEPTMRFPALPDSISPEDVQGAKARVLDVIADFPFVAESDKAAAVALFLTSAARTAIDGPTPMFAIRATAPGSGKTLLADVAALIATGRGAARMSPPKDDDEARKLIFSIGMEGASTVLLDNIEGSFGSAPFAAALTSTTFADRLLGQSKRVVVSLASVTWACTGNNLAFKGDLGRRVVPIDLDPGVEHPEDRTDFRHKNLLGHVRAERGRLVVDCLILLRSFLDDARGHDKPKMGSYEAWDDLVRCACIQLGFGDPLGGRERIREEGDNELENLRMLLLAWTSFFGSDPKTVGDALAAASEHQNLHDAFTAVLGRKELSALSLGHALRRVKGRLAGGKRFVTAGLSGGRLRWRVEVPDEPTLDFGG